LTAVAAGMDLFGDGSTGLGTDDVFSSATADSGTTAVEDVGITASATLCSAGRCTWPVTKTTTIAHH